MTVGHALVYREAERRIEALLAHNMPEETVECRYQLPRGDTEEASTKFAPLLLPCRRLESIAASNSVASAASRYIDGTSHDPVSSTMKQPNTCRAPLDSHAASMCRHIW